MSKDRPIKSFRLEGERPFKTYNIGLPSSVLLSDSWRQEHHASLQTTASNIMLQQHQLRYRQQQQHTLSVQLNQLQQHSGDYPRISTQLQPGHQNSAQSGTNLPSYDYNDVLGDSGNHHTRPDLMPPNDSYNHQGELDLHIPNVASSYSSLANFIIPNRSHCRATGAGSQMEQDPFSMMLEHPLTIFGSGLSRSMDNVSYSSLSPGQLPPGSCMPFQSIPAAVNGSSRPGVVLTFPLNKGNFPVKQEFHKAGIHLNVNPSISINSPEHSRDSFSDNMQYNQDDSVSECAIQSTATSQDKASISRTSPSGISDEKSMADASKDPAYVEKRKKNNESAKRSREARRTKEELVALRVISLEEENMKLSAEIRILDKELDELRARLYQCN